eukprot:Skav224632  [mRNA]  locus=scaffold1903:100066:110704:+ [translate_table: standard]
MWNVRTFNSQVRVGEDGNLVLEGADPEKPRAFYDTLAAAGIELCCISEVRWKGEGAIKINDHLVIYSGLPETAPQAQQGVGIVLNERMQQAWAKAGNFVETAGSRLLRIKLVIHKRVVNVISVYAPTYTNEALHKDAFYDSLNVMLGRVKACEEVFVLGDFNARGDTNDWDEWLIVGPYGLDHTNDNGERLLALCEGSKAGCLRVMSTFFPHKHYGTWYRNSSRRWFQIDHLLASRRSAKFVMDVAAKPGVGFDTDHRLVKVKLRFPPVVYQGGRINLQSNQSPKLQRKLAPLDVQGFKDPEQLGTLNTLMVNSLMTGTLMVKAVADAWHLQPRFFRTSLPCLGVQQFKLADIGEGIAEVQLTEWFVKEGDMASVELTSPYTGKVVKVHHKVQDTVKVGSVLIDVETGAGSAPAPTPPKPEPTPAPAAAPSPVKE